MHMLDKQGIYSRFIACYSLESPYELAKLLGIHHAVVYQWKDGARPVPWHRLKTLVEDQCLSWDWLIEGQEPKHQCHVKKKAGRPFNRHAINQRFLSLFPDMSNAKLGKELGVNGTTVFKWRHDMEQVSWERLKFAVDAKGVTWEWLIKGR